MIIIKCCSYVTEFQNKILKIIAIINDQIIKITSTKAEKMIVIKFFAVGD